MNRTITYAGLVAALTLAALVVGGATASAAGPSCPAGSTYNTQTRMCERSPTVVCPTGTSYDPASGLCTAAPGRTCAEGLTYNPETGNCEGSKVCPPGSTPSTTDPNLCVGSLGHVTEKICPADSTDPDGDGTCTAAPIAVTCEAGLSYDATRDQCISVAQYACPQGYGISPLNGKCQTLPIKGRKP